MHVYPCKYRNTHTHRVKEVLKIGEEMGQRRSVAEEAEGAEQSLKEEEDIESKFLTRGECGQAVLKMVGIKKT